jgi:DNA repair exonuclease SbcCD ATPase subunit
MKIISLSAENFKCFPSITINFSDVTTISGQNASGKTSTFDMFTYLLWDKDSEGSGKFNPQPIDTNGERIHNIETSVTGVFDIGGENIELKKIIAEKWTKKRGEAEPVFTGYQSKFCINGFEKKPKEYQEYIASIIDPGIFPLVSDPLAFSKLPWEKQRNILLQFVGNISDEEAAQAIENYELIKPDIHMASVSECKKKYSDIFKQHDKKCSEYLTTVQDLERRNREIDINALTEQKDALQTDINNAESLLKSVSLPGIGDLNQKIAA